MNREEAKSPAEQYLAKRGMANVGHYGLLIIDPSKSKMHQIMDDHARTQAIAFGEWLKQNAYHSDGCWYLSPGMSGEIYTTEDLYNLFIKYQNG